MASLVQHRQQLSFSDFLLVANNRIIAIFEFTGIIIIFLQELYSEFLGFRSLLPHDRDSRPHACRYYTNNRQCIFVTIVLDYTLVILLSIYLAV